MSYSSDEDLPNVALSKPSGVVTQKSKYVPYKINLEDEIKKSHINFEKELEVKNVVNEAEQLLIQETDEKLKIDDIDLKDLESIPDEPPGRQFILSGTSFQQFNVDSLVKPSQIKQLNINDLLFFHHVRKVLQELTVSETARNEKQKVLKYLLLLASVHQTPYIVECCTELLFEFNADWEINHTYLLAIFQNWGADISQVLPAFDPAPARIVKSNLDTVSSDNVNAVLQVLTAQLKLRKTNAQLDVIDEFGLWNVDELVFGLLIMLSLDTKFSACFRALQDCICQLLDGVSKRSDKWASEYSETLLYLETDIYNLTCIVCRLLNGSLACEILRRNVSFAAIQRIVRVPLQQIDHSFKLAILESHLRRTKLSDREPLEVYCLLVFANTIARDPQLSSEANRDFFYNFLEKSVMKVREPPPHLNALISSLYSLWGDGIPSAQ